VWASVQVVGVEDLGERGFRVHVQYVNDDGVTQPVESQVDVASDAAAGFFDGAVQAALASLNNRNALAAAFNSLSAGPYTLGSVTTAVQTNLASQTGGPNAPAA
jgi:hypothetical protein